MARSWNNVDDSNPWTHDFNVFTSREDANGRIYSLSSPLWLVLLVYLLTLINVLGWSVVGIIELVQRVV